VWLEILRVQAPKNVYPHFYPFIMAHHADKFGEVIPTRPKVIHPNMLNHVPIFVFMFPPHFFKGAHIFAPNF